MVCRGLDVCKRFWALRRPASSRLTSVGMVPRLARTPHPAHKLAFARRRWQNRLSIPPVTGGAPSRRPSPLIARRCAPRGQERPRPRLKSTAAATDRRVSQPRGVVLTCLVRTVESRHRAAHALAARSARAGPPSHGHGMRCRPCRA